MQIVKSWMSVKCQYCIYCHSPRLSPKCSSLQNNQNPLRLFHSAPKRGYYRVPESTNWADSKIKTWNSTNPYPRILYPGKHPQGTHRSLPSIQFSHPPMFFSPKKSVSDLLCGMTSWYFLNPDYQETFPFGTVTLQLNTPKI